MAALIVIAILLFVFLITLSGYAIGAVHQAEAYPYPRKDRA